MAKKPTMMPKGSGRKLISMRCHLPGDPPYGDQKAMLSFTKQYQAETERLAVNRAKIIATYGDLVTYHMQSGLMEHKSLDHLQAIADCPSCGGYMSSADGDVYACGNYKCKHQAMADELGL